MPWPGLGGRGLACLVGALVVVLSACASSPSGSAAAPSPPRASSTSIPSASSADSATAVPEILDFSAPALGGGTIRGADYAGSDLAIWFWAPW